MVTTGAQTARVRAAAARLYDAECALHIAHQTQVDAWVVAASVKLHDAVVEHVAAVAEQQSAAGRATTEFRVARRYTRRRLERRSCYPHRMARSPRRVR
jgi:hypothetical protein